MSRDVRTAKIVNEILKYLVVAGMVGSVLVAPNTAQIGEKALKFLDKRSRRLEGKRALQYMKRKDLIDYRELPSGELEVRITENGQRRVQQIRFDEMQIQNQRKWDGEWRLVMFDVPESRKRARRALSSKLRELGFYQLQKSVWVHAYPCSVEIEVIKRVFGIPDRDIIVAKISDFDRQNLLLNYFKLHA